METCLCFLQALVAVVEEEEAAGVDLEAAATLHPATAGVRKEAAAAAAEGTEILRPTTRPQTIRHPTTRPPATAGEQALPHLTCSHLRL